VAKPGLVANFKRSTNYVGGKAERVSVILEGRKRGKIGKAWENREKEEGAVILAQDL